MKNVQFFKILNLTFIVARGGHVKSVFAANIVDTWCEGSSDRSFMVDPLSYLTKVVVFAILSVGWCI